MDSSLALRIVQALRRGSRTTSDPDGDLVGAHGPGGDLDAETVPVEHEGHQQAAITIAASETPRRTT